MNRIAFLILFVPSVLWSQESDQTFVLDATTIAFGSCSDQNKTDQQLWKEVEKVSPDVWLWLGDNIYGDSEDMTVIREKYDLQKSHPNYQKLLQKTKVLGIWDDHDYGVNDGGKDFPKKDESKAELFRFLDVDPSNPANARKGAYQSYTFKGEKNIKFILLDGRYFRDPLKKDENNQNIPDPEGEILGQKQWDWLTSQLKDESADAIILASGIQVIPEQHRFEKWANFPTEREKLFSMIASVKVPVILISGDRHMSEASKIDVPGLDYPLYEFTSSSLNRPWGEPKEEANQYREKDIVYKENFASMTLKWKGTKLTVDLSYIGKGNKILQRHLVTY